jgi:hypothetical protein
MGGGEPIPRVGTVKRLTNIWKNTRSYRGKEKRNTATRDCRNVCVRVEKNKQNRCVK